MRIAILNKFLFQTGGPERYLETVRAGLVAEGHQVGVAGIGYTDVGPETPGVVHRIPPRLPPGQYSLSGPTLTGTAKLRTAAATIFNVAAYRSMREFFTVWQPDVLYVLNYVNHLSASPIVAARRAGIPVAVRCSDYFFKCPKWTFFRDGHECHDCSRNPLAAVRHRCVGQSRLASTVRVAGMVTESSFGWLRDAEALIAPSQMMAQELLSYGASTDCIHVVPTPVSNTFFKAGREIRTGKRVLYVGRITEEKGLATLFRAASRLPTDVEIRVAGDVSRREALDLCSNAPANVTLLGRLTANQVGEEICAAACVVVPSLWPENSPNSLLEAGAAGAAVIVSDAPTLVELVHHGKTGLVVPRGEPEPLAHAIMTLIQHPHLAGRLGLELQSNIAARHSLPVHLRKLVTIFSAITKKRPA